MSTLANFQSGSPSPVLFQIRVRWLSRPVGDRYTFRVPVALPDMKKLNVKQLSIDVQDRLGETRTDLGVYSSAYMK